MSERELRQGIACHLCPEEAECGLCNAARKALSAEPDVVALLQWADGQGFWDFCRYIEERFHVRLIDEAGTSVPGWEYIAE